MVLWDASCCLPCQPRLVLSWSGHSEWRCASTLQRPSTHACIMAWRNERLESPSSMIRPSSVPTACWFPRAPHHRGLPVPAGLDPASPVPNLWARQYRDDGELEESEDPARPLRCPGTVDGPVSGSRRLCILSSAIIIQRLSYRPSPGSCSSKQPPIINVDWRS